MTVISNTSPLNYLRLIDLQDILPALFGRVLIPVFVFGRLQGGHIGPPLQQPSAAGLPLLPSGREGGREKRAGVMRANLPRTLNLTKQN